MAAEDSFNSLVEIARRWYIQNPDKRYVSKVLQKFSRDRIVSVIGRPKGRPKGTLKGQDSVVELMAEIQLLHENEPNATVADFKEHLEDRFQRTLGLSTVRKYLAKAGISFRNRKR